MQSHTRRTFLKIGGGVLGGIAAGTTVTAATSADRYIVRAKPKDDLSGVSVVHDLREHVGVAVVKGDESALESARVKYAPDLVYELDQPVDPVPADVNDEVFDEPMFTFQWDKRAINAPEAQAITRGEGARVAIIDSGIAADHPDLTHAVNTSLGQDFTGDGLGANVPGGGYHGTHVAGIVAANDENDEGVVGVAPGAELVDCRVFSTDVGASFGDVFAAMVYSTLIGSDVANLSLGAYPIPRPGLGSFYGGVLNSITSFCRRNGTMLSVAAGNDAADLQHDGHICADFDGDGDEECYSVISIPNEAANVVSVSATGPIGFGWGGPGLHEDYASPSFYTNYGTNAIDVSAPGGDADLDAVAEAVEPWYFDMVLSTVSEFDDSGDVQHSHGWAAGTSMAAPQVSGVAALVKSQNPRYNANKLRNTVLGGAEDMADNAFHGRGFLDAHGALQ